MLSFSYILSPTVSVELEKIEATRNNILLQLIPPRTETRLRFENLVRVISSSQLLSGKSVSPREIVNTLKGIKRQSSQAQEILGVKEAIDYMREGWLMEEGPVTPEAFHKLIRMLSHKRKIDGTELAQIAAFINASPEHPIIQSALSFILTYDLLGDNNDSIKLSSIVSNCFAYDHGYDFRGMINLQQYFFADLANLKEKIKTAVLYKNLSPFIEYYVQVFSIEAENALGRIRDGKMEKNKSMNLTTREMRILSLFEIPDIKVSNKTIQKEFDVSQITASRDLASLSTLGLIIRKGKGRSVYYIKG